MHHAQRIAGRRPRLDRTALIGLAALAFVFQVSVSPPIASAQEAEAAAKPGPITAGASAAAKKLLVEFYDRAGRKANRVAIGQQLITWEYGKKSDPKAWYGDWLQLEKAHLPLPLIMGGEVSDLERYGGFYPNKDALNELIAHGKRGNIVTLVWHPALPVKGGDFGTPIDTSDLEDLVDDKTAAGKAWQEQLDRAAAVLKQFDDANVPVLFRPLHEQNGTFFWWGHDGAKGGALKARQKAWTAVWADLVEELTQRRGLKNLLFVFGTNQVNYNEVAPPLTYYPGDKLVDLVSIDVYDDELDLAGSNRGLDYYKDLVGTGKPFGLSEFGQSFGNKGTGPDGAKWDARTLTKRLGDSYEKAVFAIAWYSSREGDPPQDYLFALPDVAHAKEVLDDPLIDTQ